MKSHIIFTNQLLKWKREHHNNDLFALLLLCRNKDIRVGQRLISVKLKTFLNIIIFNLNKLFYTTNTMCFFKTLHNQKGLQNMASPPSKLQKPSLVSQSHTQADFYSLNQIEEKPQMKLDSGILLLNCLNLMSLNSQFLFNIDQKLNQTSEILQSTEAFLEDSVQTQEPVSAKRSALFNMNLPQNGENSLYEAVDSLTNTLFGHKQYQYRLVLNGEFPSTLYKERNFSCSLKLIDIASGKQKNNGNIINVCFGVCDSKGEWIHETKEGQAFVKGKIETELYHGSAEFVKLAPRDVSRPYQNKTVNIVVYPKPSVLRYSGESSIEEHIDYSLVEPLIVRDVCIKAKKRD